MKKTDKQNEIDKAAAALIGMRPAPDREKEIPFPTKVGLERKFRMVTKGGKARIEEVGD